MATWQFDDHGNDGKGEDQNDNNGDLRRMRMMIGMRMITMMRAMRMMLMGI